MHGRSSSTRQNSLNGNAHVCWTGPTKNFLEFGFNLDILELLVLLLERVCFVVEVLDMGMKLPQEHTGINEIFIRVCLQVLDIHGDLVRDLARLNLVALEADLYEEDVGWK